MKKIIKKILEKNNVIINKVHKNHLVDLESPLDAIYYNGEFGQRQLFSFDVPIDKCVNIYGYQFYSPSSHHFTATLVDYAKNPKMSFEESKLHNFYESFKPKDLKSLYFSYSNLESISYYNNSPLLSNKPQVITLPWLTDIVYTSSEINGRKRNEAGLSFKEGSQSFGPVTQAKGNLEFSRLINVYKSIKTKGYTVDYFHNQISGYFMKKHNDFRFIIQNGNHRTAALAALGNKSLPVIFRYDYPRVIDINDIDIWPQVKNGNVAKDDAKTIFYTIFEGKDFSSIFNKNKD